MTQLLVPYHLDEYLTDFISPVVPDSTLSVSLPEADIWRRLTTLYDAVATDVARIRGNDQVPVVVSGDCTTSLGVVSGLQRAGLRAGVVWFDAHGDVQTLETSESGYIGGMPIRFLVGYRPELISSNLGLTPIAEEQVLLVGARDLDPPEQSYLDTVAIRRCPVTDVYAQHLPDGPIYLHLDVDVVDSSDIPALRFPVDGGPSLSEVDNAVVRILRTGRVVALGIAGTWRPASGAEELLRAKLSRWLQEAG